MNYLSGNDEAVSALTDDVMRHSIYTFSLQQEDYLQKFFMNYEKITTTIYTFEAGKVTINIPSGMYVYVGDVSGSTDWVLVDELIGRSGVEAFLMPKDFTSWQLRPLVLKNVYEGSYYYPSTRDAVPIITNCGNMSILASSVDLYHQWKHKDYDVAFVV